MGKNETLITDNWSYFLENYLPYIWIHNVNLTFLLRFPPPPRIFNWSLRQPQRWRAARESTCIHKQNIFNEIHFISIEFDLSFELEGKLTKNHHVNHNGCGVNLDGVLSILKLLQPLSGEFLSDFKESVCVHFGSCDVWESMMGKSVEFCVKALEWLLSVVPQTFPSARKNSGTCWIK